MSETFNAFLFATNDLSWAFLEPQLLPLDSAWLGHIPFAHWVVAACRPRLIVELGTHQGASYAAFCGAVAQMQLETRCFAVDSWEGDAHSGPYPEAVYEHISRYNAEHYARFSTLLRMRFEAALPHFADGSIDLLHIDGFHSYEAVRHDFETWLPKLSAQAVVLLHDTHETDRDFGVWRYWAELSAHYRHFAFPHCHGLGVLAVGSEAPRAIMQLCNDLSPPMKQRVQMRFAALGAQVELKAKVRRLEKHLARLTSPR